MDDAALALAPDEEGTLDVRAWLPREVGKRAGNRSAEVTRQFAAGAAGS